MNLFQITDIYSKIYDWFGILSKKDGQMLAYVIMPNHIHLLLYAGHNMPRLNKLIGNGKRFLAYEIIKRLKSRGQEQLLLRLAEGVQPGELKVGKKHQVFQLSFDARVCHSTEMIEQKLDYIHQNPVSGKWNLVDDFTKYPHSSAAFYETEANIKFPVRHYKDIL
jgi:hypothetical protein